MQDNLYIAMGEVFSSFGLELTVSSKVLDISSQLTIFLYVIFLYMELFKICSLE
jgi:hypothetical protein